MDQLRTLYLIFIGVIAIQRLSELYISKKNNDILKKCGALEFGKKHFLYMKIVHIFWLLSCFLGALKTSPPESVPYYALILFLIGQTLRYLAMIELGKRWTANIMVLPGEAPIRKGIYKYIKHPNYLGVIIEMATLPLLWELYEISIIFSILNLIILKVRIRDEELALISYNNYENQMKSQKRFLPGLF